ncbi:MAG TPA: transporter [Thermoanaerobaculia bacterium]|nr:transporter [Thermoanaerobaculia bacterium]
MKWLVLLLLFAADALARVGGGDSYSGGGSSGGGGGGDGIPLELLWYLFRFLFWLTVEYPLIGIPVDIIVILAIIKWLRSRPNMKAIHRATTHREERVARMDELRKFDPNFSEITFSDFCYSLYARAHAARGTGDLDRYAPYLSAGARNALRSRNPKGLREVRGIVVGSFKVTGLRGLDGPNVTATVVYESNYTELSEAGEQSWYAVEQWTLERRRDILSPPPEKAKADHCPRCGAALATRTDGACEYCGAKIQDGAFQWYVRGITLLSREARGPLLTSNVPEVGTDAPTRFQHHFGERRKSFNESNPGFDWRAFEQRVREVATELQDAWTARDWERVRPLESESLFQMHRYWIDAYRRQKLRNVVAEFRVLRVEPVKIDADAFYESITVRIWAEGRDHTVDEGGKVVAGSKSDVRRWSEYWTFIRSRGASVSGTAARSCPNCGAKVALGATGICPYCGGKLTTGEFDWVLSRIEQDEAYAA